MNADQLSDSELKSYAEDHIQYEFDMLLWSARILYYLSSMNDKGYISWVIHDSLLNSFSIHARNLTEFLYFGDKPNRKSSDVVIENYMEKSILFQHRPPISKLLDTVITKSNKQVAHLTTNRIQYELEGKGWNFLEIVMEIKGIFSKIASFIPDERISENLKEKFSEEELDIPIIQVKVINNINNFPIGLEIKFQ